MRKICVVTGTRAEYGLLYWLIKAISEDSELDLQLIVTGMHLSPEFGSTWKRIEKDCFPIAKKIEILLSTDTAVGISKSNALGLISFSEAFAELLPDIIVLLGDRTETLAAATAALIAGIPVAHIGGGELTEGAYDEAIRHSVTKMSHLHFTANERYRKRVIQLGEHPETVFNVGAIGLDSTKRLKLLTKIEVERSLGRELQKNNLLITFHPVTLEDNSAEDQFKQLLGVLDELEDTLLIFTKPNSDKGGRIIIQQIDDYVRLNPGKAVSYTSMGQLLYFSVIQFMDAVVGNSSSGIIEVPFFGVPTINIGDRQKGRIMGETVLNCKPEKKAIRKALDKVASNLIIKKKQDSPYGKGGTTEKILAVLKKTKRIELKKRFFDLPQSH